MKSFAAPVLVFGAITAAATGFAGTAHAAPSGPEPADRTVSELQSQGYRVFVNKVGTAPLESCVVSAVRPGQTYTRTDTGSPGAMDDIVTTVTARTVYVDVTC